MEARAGSRMILMLLVLTQCRGHPAPVRDYKQSMEADEQQYLAQFGYLPPSAKDVGHLMSKEVLEKALKNLQTYGKIPATGEMDSATKELMAKPRCGMPDRSPNTRRKRFAVGRAWPSSQITWRLDDRTVPPELRSEITSVKYDLRMALDIWARGTPLNFHEVDRDSADIQISFKRGHHAVDEQGADTAFDGPGKVLAHAFFPGTGLGGDAHFDLDEKWKTTREDRRRSGTSLSAVAIHEFGHSLGLMHSADPKAIMYAYLVQEATWDKLPDDDMAGIHQLYPTVRQNPQPPPDVPRRPTQQPDYRPPQQPRQPDRPYQPERRPYEPDRTPDHRPPQLPRQPDRPYQPERQPYEPDRTPDRRPPYQPDYPPDPRYTTPTPNLICSQKPDAIARMRGEVFVFTGDRMWRLNVWPPPGGELPRSSSVAATWQGLPVGEKIDAVYEGPRGQMRLFVGQKIYEYGSPHKLDALLRLTDLGLPAEITKIDAATQWNGKTYLLVGRHYWHLDENQNTPRVVGHPRLIDDKWRGVDNDLDAVFQWPPGRTEPGSTLFFKGRSTSRFDPGYTYPDPPERLPFCLDGYEHFSGASTFRISGPIVVITSISLIFNNLLR